ncbi:DEAD/DEAH box helicase [Anaerolineae bacterium CFX7]|nr:DEAD/DEAH box helicase [Anaerolineae bacterium CFX7]
MALSESDTRAKLIDPALHARGWTEDLIKREETAGGIEIVNGAPRRKKGRVDYLLRVRVTPQTSPVAVAVLEAKRDDDPPTLGLEQAKIYAKRLNVPFVFSSNGYLFSVCDVPMGFTQLGLALAEFPTPDELRARFMHARNIVLESDAARPLLMPYKGGESGRRYYQDAAIRAVLEKIAAGEKRALLSLATGAGKTYIAVQLLKKIADAGQLKRALFLVDRDELRSQALGALQNVFSSDAAEVSGGNPQLNARILIATYQTLDIAREDDSGNFLTAHYPENYFSHIIIDECHRSAWNKWKLVLERNWDAIQIGLTATPREIVGGNEDEQRADQRITANNLEYFGEPVYEYTLAQGIEDGYLAACEVIRREIDIDQIALARDEILKRAASDAITGGAVNPRDVRDEYQAPAYESALLLPDRVRAMCKDLFENLLLTGGPHQKTIIFCARETHASAVAAEMGNLYAEWRRTQNIAPKEFYAFECTGTQGSEHLADLRGLRNSHFVACTVELLTTGVDVPNVRNIVFFKYVQSPIQFHQMIGRGTRLDAESGKLMFRVYDYTNASRLFGGAFVSRPAPLAPLPKGEGDGEEDAKPHPIRVEGFEVRVSEAGRMIVTQRDGRDVLATLEEYQELLADSITRQEIKTLDSLRQRWIVPEARKLLLERLPDGERGAKLLQQLLNLSDYDLYDVLADLAFGAERKTRVERANALDYKQAAWLNALPPDAANTLRALAQQFARGGIEALETRQVFNAPAVRDAGGLQALQKIGAADILRETKEKLLQP